MLGNGGGLAGSLFGEPPAREIVAEDTVFLDERAVRDVAHERVAKRELGLVLERRGAERDEDLVREKFGEREIERCVDPSSERADRTSPRHAPENACGTEDAPRFDRQRCNARFDDGRNRRRKRVVVRARRHGADELLHEERVAIASVDDGTNGLGGRRGSERFTDERRTCVTVERTERHTRERPFGPQVREPLVDLGPTERDHEDSPIGERAKRCVEVEQTRKIGVVEIVDDDEHGPMPADATYECEEGSPHLIAHADAIGPRAA